MRVVWRGGSPCVPQVSSTGRCCDPEPATTLQAEGLSPGPRLSTTPTFLAGEPPADRWGAGLVAVPSWLRLVPFAFCRSQTQEDPGSKYLPRPSRSRPRSPLLSSQAWAGRAAGGRVVPSLPSAQSRAPGSSEPGRPGPGMRPHPQQPGLLAPPQGISRGLAGGRGWGSGEGLCVPLPHCLVLKSWKLDVKPAAQTQNRHLPSTG